MKINKIFGFVLALGFMQNTIAQLVIPHPIPCIKINPGTIDTLPSGVSAVDCIEVDGETVNFKTDQHYSIRAGEYIQFDPNTVITSDGSHQFHAYIQREDMDMAWYYPNATPGTVGQYEKLEIGVQFSDTIHQKIENFVTNQPGSKLNPFNPEDVDLYAEFWVLKELPFGAGMAWFGPQKVNGFYYEEFARNADTIHWDTLAIDHQFRIRFAPPATGLYRCKVSANVYGHGVQTVSEFTFESVPSDNKGFMQVGENKRYFEFGEEPFFPIGHNIFSPEDSLHIEDYKPTPVEPYCYLSYYRRLKKFKESGGNYFRYIVSPWNTEMEFEHLGNYSNRLAGAWEFDRILDSTKALGLKMHYNMQIHYAFEAPNNYLKFHWDWSAAGDTLNTPITPFGEIGCFRSTQGGYCYRTELDIEHPKDFFTDTTAMQHYKNRIRYMEARWGYSTEIAVTEILSEASHCGTYTQFDMIDSECTAVGGSRPYDTDSTTFPHNLFKWHETMANYMNDSLQSNHLIAVNFPGKPDIANGDFSYFLDAVDIMTWNTYQLSIKNIETTYDDVIKYQTIDDGYNIHKPILCSEYGTGTDTYKCDQNAGFIHRICTGPFTGLAGMPMTWDDQNDVLDLWHYYQNVNDLMSGIQLDNENWFAGEPQVQNDKSVEMFYLRKGELGENTKIVGVVANRTYNYWTQGIGSPCDSAAYNPEGIDNDIELNFVESDLHQNIKFKDMGVYNGYQIEWINALTGEAIDTTEKISDSFGHLKLEFPGALTGNASSPILFFKLYRTDATFLAPIIPDENQAGLPVDFVKDESLSFIEQTDWNLSIKDDLKVTIAPNPTDGIINVIIKSSNDESCNWELLDANGRILTIGNTTSPNFNLDISVYAKGVYYLKVYSLTNQVQTKIVKL